MCKSVNPPTDTNLPISQNIPRKKSRVAPTNWKICHFAPNHAQLEVHMFSAEVGLWFHIAVAGSSVVEVCADTSCPHRTWEALSMAGLECNITEWHHHLPCSVTCQGENTELLFTRIVLGISTATLSWDLSQQIICCTSTNQLTTINTFKSWFWYWGEEMELQNTWWANFWTEASKLLCTLLLHAWLL